MKKLFYVVAFAIPIAIMFVGLLKGDMKLLTFIASIVIFSVSPVRCRDHRSCRVPGSPPAH